MCVSPAPTFGLPMNVDRLSTICTPGIRALRIALTLACAGIALVLPGCGERSPDAGQKQGAGAPPAIPVTVVQAQLQRVPIALEAVGQAEGSRDVEIRARVSGILEKRLFTEGAPVKAGAVLFHIDRAPYEIAVAQASAALAQERARLELTQRESERLKTLVQSKAISQREYDESVSAFKQASASIEGAKARLAEANLNLSYTSVKAPISGITGRAVRSEGSLVTANTEASLLTTLAQVDPIWVRFSLAEPDFERMRGTEKRTQVQILAQDGTISAENGRLNFASSAIDAKLGTVQLRAEFPNPRQKWLPGQFVKVRILAGEREAFLVPQAAVVQTAQARLVWVAEADGKATPRPVETAGWSGANWIVTGGLKPGEAVIIDNLIKMRPGAIVKLHAPGAGPAQAPPGAAPAGAGSKKTAPAPAS